MTTGSDTLRFDNGLGPSRRNTDWAVTLIAHGSQRGADRSECSCAWVESDSGPPDWCQKCPSTLKGLHDASGRVRTILNLDTQQLVLSCLEFIEPNPQQAVGILKERGFRNVMLVPFLLGNGKHATLELDEITEDLKADTPGVQIYLAEGLGADPHLAELVVERVRSMDWPPTPPRGDRPTAGVVLVKAGTKTQYDDCLWLEEIARSVEAQLGREYAVEIAQSHYGDPTMESATEHLVRHREVSSLLYVPYLFFPGLILKRNVLGTMARLRESYPDIPLAVTPPLGAETHAAAVAAQRIRETWQQAHGG